MDLRPVLDLRPLLMTSRETATELRVSERKVDYMIASGELQSVKVGRCRRILRSSVEALATPTQAAS